MKKFLLIVLALIIIAAAFGFLYRDKLDFLKGSAFTNFEKEQPVALPGEEPIVLPRK